MAMGYSGIGGSSGSMSDGKARVIKTSGSGRSSIVKGSGTDVFDFGPSKGIKNAGQARFDVTNRSINKGGASRKM